MAKSKVNREADLDVGVFDYAIHYGMLHTRDNRLIPTELNGQLYLGTGKGKVSSSREFSWSKLLMFICSPPRYPLRLLKVVSMLSVQQLEFVNLVLDAMLGVQISDYGELDEMHQSTLIEVGNIPCSWAASRAAAPPGAEPGPQSINRYTSQGRM